MKLLALLFFAFFGLSTVKAQCDTEVREAFGGVSSITIYNTYITIGAIADAHVNEVYDAARVKELMGEQTSMLQAVIDMLDKCKVVKSNGLSADDVEYVKDLIVCLQSLKAEAQGLSDYAATQSEDAQNRYNTNRDKAWSEIKTLMGLE
ncbi:hypothetical protein [Fluviicola chungangensis]|uniref:Uncharacterized protein n=1 Tax=Fluviicola chungangensis TaxID=2597671 RepID=A0A556N3I3_9FLAO|nr:hypothetical protein [Fluviicola chungangensis]TSJ46655.1 hypothetical protein FO442_05710 [Fluviicola chungangensis]